MLDEILANLETYRRSEGNFRLDPHLHKVGMALIEGLRDRNPHRISEARNMLREFMDEWERKDPKGRVRLFRSFLVFTISFISVVSRRRIREIVEGSGVSENDDMLTRLVDFTEMVLDMFLRLYDKTKKHI